uniref:Small EDRK-rich factor-like N-terminal domain-containing protein n=1 Tax=Acrobeloides nanus TaxID=290746 RepID=A0A914D2F5_9BILA
MPRKGLGRSEQTQNAKSNGVKGNRDVQKSSKTQMQKAQKEGVVEKSSQGKSSKQLLKQKLVNAPSNGVQENILGK